MQSKIPVFAVNTRNQNSSKWTQNIGPQQWTPNKGNAHSTSNIITSTPNVRNFELPLKSRYQPCGEGSSAPARIPRHRNPTLPNFTPPSASGSPGAGFLAGEKLSPIEVRLTFFVIKQLSSFYSVINFFNAYLRLIYMIIKLEISYVYLIVHPFFV